VKKVMNKLKLPRKTQNESKWKIIGSLTKLAVKK